MIFLSYSALTLSASSVFPFGQVARLHEWHWALIFALWRQMLWYILEYLWPPASSSRFFRRLQDIQKPSQFSLVSLSFEFSWAMSSANWSFWFLLGFFVLYSLWGLPSRSLSSFFAFLSYSNFFLTRSDWCFFQTLPIWYSVFFSFCSLIFCIFRLALIFALKQYWLYLYSRDFMILSLVFFICKKFRN